MTFLDKLKIGKFLLTNDKWTVGPEIEKYEKKWSEYTGCKYVVMVHSGSAANEMIALRRRDQLIKQGKWIPGQNKVLFNVVNWISSVSVFSNLSFKPVFVDVDLSNLNPSVEQIESKLKADPEIKTVFYTTLLGQSCDLEKLIYVCSIYGAELFLDNCESSFSWEIFNKADPFCHQKVHFCNLTLSSTSIYASHYTSGLQEGGLLFAQDEETYEWLKMMRNHGMTRGMPDKYRNPLVDPSFDFNVMGSNYRTTNLIAYMHSLDFDRSLKWSEENRRNIAGYFYSNINPVKWDRMQPIITNKFDRPIFNHSARSGHIPLALPIIKHPDYQDGELIGKVKGYLSAVGVGYRGLVGSNLLYHTAFQGLGNPKDYPNADYLHHNSIYIGLHAGVDSKMAVSLAKELSKL
jgi:CDP-6-deoxy-D-xylo-4-hexulose-3-dehydrase